MVWTHAEHLQALVYSKLRTVGQTVDTYIVLLHHIGFIGGRVHTQVNALRHGQMTKFTSGGPLQLRGHKKDNSSFLYRVTCKSFGVAENQQKYRWKDQALRENKRPRARFKPRPFLLWGNSSNHWATVLTIPLPKYAHCVRIIKYIIAAGTGVGLSGGRKWQCALYIHPEKGVWDLYWFLSRKNVERSGGKQRQELSAARRRV